MLCRGLYYYGYVVEEIHLAAPSSSSIEVLVVHYNIVDGERLPSASSLLLGCDIVRDAPEAIFSRPISSGLRLSQTALECSSR